MGKAVLDLQSKLPRARVVYASATGRLTHKCIHAYMQHNTTDDFKNTYFSLIPYSRCLWAKEHDLYEPPGNLGWGHALQSLWWLPTCHRKEVCRMTYCRISLFKAFCLEAFQSWIQSIKSLHLLENSLPSGCSYGWLTHDWIMLNNLCVVCIQRCWCHGDCRYGHESERDVHRQAAELLRCVFPDWRDRTGQWLQTCLQ